MSTLMFRIRDPREVPNPNHVKVVTDQKGFALYFSRQPIPITGTPALLTSISNTSDSMPTERGFCPSSHNSSPAVSRPLKNWNNFGPWSTAFHSRGGNRS